MIIEARDDVVSLSGHLERNLWPAIQAAANLLLRLHPNGILIDASQITHCSDDGARTFLDAMDYIERHRARIVLCHPPAALLETLKHVPGLRSQLPIAETCEQGRASLELASDIRRRRPGGVRGSADGNGALRPRLVMLPLTDPGAGGALEDITKSLRASLGLALQIGMRLRGAADDDVETDSGDAAARPKRQIAPLLHFLYLLEVPRTMPLNSPMTDEEGRAKIALDTAAALADSVGAISQSSVARTRDAGEEIASQAAELGAEIVILSLPSEGALGREALEPVVDSVLQRARCQVVVKNWPA